MGLHQTPLMIASLLLCIGSASRLSAQRICAPSYCGNLQISYPFRLKGDKATCGDRRYELTCDGNNRTIIDINSGKYYVKSISYSKGDKRIRIIDVGLASGGCALPAKTLSLDTISRDERFTFSPSPEINDILPTEVCFVNCTREIKRWLGVYSHVPCLSGSNASVYVLKYARVGGFAPSCRYLAMVLSNKRVFQMDEDVFKYLQNGISLEWANPSCDPVPFVVKNCYAEL